MIHKVYEVKIEKYKAQEASLEKLSKLYFYGKLGSFIGLVVLGYSFYPVFSTLNIVILLLLAVLYIVSYILDSKCRGKIDFLRRLQHVCSKEIAYLNEDFSSFNNGEKYVDLQHEFSFDLDIFGESSLFHRVNRTVTQKGSDKLAYKFTHLGKSKKDIVDNQEAISELSSLLDWRIKFISNSFVDNNLDLLSEYVFVNKPRYNKFLVKSVVPYILIGATSVFLLLAVLGVLPWLYFSSMFLFQLLLTTVISKVITRSSFHADKLHKEYAGYLSILRDIYAADFKSMVLINLKKELFETDKSCLISFQELSKILDLFDQRGNVVMYILLNGTMLFDIILVRMFVKWGQKYLPHVEQWIDCIAEVDALVSLSTYAFNNPKNRIAKVLDDDSDDVIQAEDVYHPFFAYGKAVSNDFILKKTNIAIITGANMAGKSTFLRTIGISYVLASNGVPVCAKFFNFSIVALFSSMRTTDNLSKDLSYFNAELIRLKQLIEYVKSHSYTLIILDEILKGTNSRDKLKGSIMFLEKLSKYNISSLIATHDLELSKLEDQESNTYSNYCFEIELSDNINYTYKIQSGVAQNLNASYLLSNILKEL